MWDERVKIIRGTRWVVCLTEDVVNAEQPHLSAASDPRAESISRERVNVTRKGVQLIPVHESVDEK